MKFFFRMLFVLLMIVAMYFQFNEEWAITTIILWLAITARNVEDMVEDMVED